MSKGYLCAAVATVFIWGVSTASAIIIHPVDDGQPGLFKPSDVVMAAYNNDASAVVVGPNHIITTRHQGGGINVPVVIEGVTYYAKENIIIGDADLRLVRISQDLADTTPANLTKWVNIYTGTDELTKVATIGGFGVGRGATLQTPGNVDYAYQWAGGTNTVLRWGANRIEGFEDDYEITSGSNTYISDYLLIDFDDVDTGGYVDHEAATTLYDSGGGWFIFDDGQWKLAAISGFVERLNQSRFRDPVTAEPDPDVLAGIRLSSYTEELFVHIPEPGTLALLLTAAPLLFVRSRRTQNR